MVENNNVENNNADYATKPKKLWLRMLAYLRINLNIRVCLFIMFFVFITIALTRYQWRQRLIELENEVLLLGQEYRQQQARYIAHEKRLNDPALAQQRIWWIAWRAQIELLQWVAGFESGVSMLDFNDGRAEIIFTLVGQREDTSADQALAYIAAGVRELVYWRGEVFDVDRHADEIRVHWRLIAREPLDETGVEG